MPDKENFQHGYYHPSQHSNFWPHHPTQFHHHAAPPAPHHHHPFSQYYAHHPHHFGPTPASASTLQAAANVSSQKFPSSAFFPSLSAVQNPGSHLSHSSSLGPLAGGVGASASAIKWGAAPPYGPAANIAPPSAFVAFQPNSLTASGNAASDKARSSSFNGFRGGLEPQNGLDSVHRGGGDKHRKSDVEEMEVSAVGGKMDKKKDKCQKRWGQQSSILSRKEMCLTEIERVKDRHKRRFVKRYPNPSSGQRIFRYTVWLGLVRVLPFVRHSGYRVLNNVAIKMKNHVLAL